MNISISITDDGPAFVYREAIANHLRGILLSDGTPEFHRGAEVLATMCGVYVHRYEPAPALPEVTWADAVQ
jgi:hypothetical protein